MRRFIFSIIILSTCLLANVQGQPVTESEVRTVAGNWIKVIIARKGSWGDSNDARLAGISEFKRKGRTIGYFCKVEPMGYIIVSLRKELAPVKAYSDTGNLNPDCEEGLADLIKGKMEQIINGIERTTGPIKTAKTQDIRSILEIDYSSDWNELLSGTVGVQTKESEAQGQFETMNYQEGVILLTSSWNQDDPYNLQCPAPGSGDDCAEARCAVGCGPLSMAQVMRYWAWPPYKDPFTVSYDWANMPDRLFAGPTPPRSPLAQIDAVATLCREAGVEAGADYCDDKCATSTYFAGYIYRDMLDAFEEHFHYSSAAEHPNRDSYSADDWFNLIQGELNANRPIPYAVKAHVMVCDGWQIVDSTKQYHMNYGWNDANGPCPSHSNAWYTLDELCLGDFDEEELLNNLYPACSLGSSLSNFLFPDLPVSYGVPSPLTYRYFNVDATGNDVTFAAGHHLQFLPGVTATGTSLIGKYIQFLGTPADNTRLFSIKGTSTGGSVAGAVIYDGEIRLYNNGSIRFH